MQRSILKKAAVQVLFTVRRGSQSRVIGVFEAHASSLAHGTSNVTTYPSYELRAAGQKKPGRRYYSKEEGIFNTYLGRLVPQ